MTVYSPSLGKTFLGPPEVTILGAGVMGLALALELQVRGAKVAVVDRGLAGQQASWAAAGMLAAGDPENPAAIQELAQYSIGLYPAFLDRIAQLSGISVPFQTEVAWQHREGAAPLRLEERSVDPRQLVPALLAAVRAAGANFSEEDASHAAHGLVVHTSGAWFGEHSAGFVRPRKGQMLRVRIPAGLQLTEVHRSEAVYVVPRTTGPQAGTALIGATVEDAGFDVTTHEADLRALRAMGAGLVPALGSSDAAPMVEAWAGLRPATADGLPLLGAWKAGEFVATGHYRNGILLAPGTTRVMADLMERKTPALSLDAFTPARAGSSGSWSG